MDFTPHSRLKSGKNTSRNDVEDNKSDGGAFEIHTDEWLENHHPFSILLKPHSLLIFKDLAYSGQFLTLLLSPVIVLWFSSCIKNWFHTVVSRLLAWYKRY